MVKRGSPGAYVKITVFKAHYAKFLNGLGTLFDPLDDVAISLSAKEAYKAMDTQDERLARIWADKTTSDGQMAKMLSARAAEKAVIALYRAQGCKVEDIAILQLDSNTGDWRTHDLRIDDTIALDIKNSRRPINGKHFYVEHTVPAFKLDRRGRDVRIAGVLSPYLKIDAIRAPEKEIQSNCEDLVYLGETDASGFDKLVTTLRTPTFRVEASRGRTIPNWVFDYPANWYAAFLKHRDVIINTCSRPENDEWQYVLPAQDLQKVLPALLALDIDLPNSVLSELPDWKKTLSATLARNQKVLPRLPAIYVTILMDFVEKLGSTPSNFSPADYKSLLFPPGGGQKSGFPLGIIDPLGIVTKLIEALEEIWLKRDKIKLDNLVTFRFSGLGILEGKALRSDRWDTLIAYCGGTVHQKDERGKIKFDSYGKPSFQSKCGNSPLIKGRHQNCTECGRLVCDKCGFCTKACETARHKKQFEEAQKSSRQRQMPAWEVIPIEAYSDGY